MQQDIGSKTKSSLIWNTSLKIVYQIFRFAISIVVARILDPKDFGIMGIATMVIMYADNITSFGFNRALVHKKEINDTHINSVFTLNVSISVFLTAAVILFSGWIADFFQVPELKSVLLSLSCIFVISSFYQMPLTLMKRQLNFKVVALTELFRGILQSFVTLFLAILGFGYWALVVGFIVSFLFGAFYILFKVRWRPSIKYNHTAMKDIFNFGFWNFMRVQTYQVNEYADKFIIGKFLGPVLLGFYDKAFSTVAFQKGSFTMQINSVMFSSFSRLQSETSDTIKRYLKKTLSVVSLITFPLNMGLFALGTHFVLVLFGSKWAPMVEPLKILTFAFIFSTLTGLCSSLNIGTGNYVKQTVREGICNILLILTCLIAAQYGIEFVAFGVLFVYAVTFLATFQLTRNKVDMRWADLVESILPATIGSVGMLSVMILSRRIFFSEITVTNFILLFLIGAVTYSLIIFFPRYPILEEYRTSVILHAKNIFGRFSAASK